MSLFVKSVWPLFGKFWVEIRQLFIPSCGHTEEKPLFEYLEQRTLTYGEVSLFLQLTSCLFCLDSVALLMFAITTVLLVWSNPNQSNSRSAVQ